MKKVLVICGSLEIGGAERVAANICKFAKREEFEIHYLVFDGFGRDYADEIKANGGMIFSVPSPTEGHFSYIKNLGKLMSQEKYDVVHSHTQFNSGINLWVANKNHVPIRIAHSHTTKTEHSVSNIRLVYEAFMRHLIRQYATHYCACGIQAGEWMFGGNLFGQEGIVIKNGIDTELFSYSEENRRKIRERLGVDENTFIIGHSGLLSELKNQEFLIRLMPEILKEKDNTKLLLLGRDSGGMTDRLKEKAADLGVLSSVIFNGPVMNVNEYLSAIDVFAFPSLREGTPLALLEAQTNGLPCIVSDTIPNDAVITGLVKMLPLNNSKGWINEICSSTRKDCRRWDIEVENAGYGIRSSYEKLFQIYRGIRL